MIEHDLLHWSWGDRNFLNQEAVMPIKFYMYRRNLRGNQVVRTVLQGSGIQ